MILMLALTAACSRAENNVEPTRLERYGVEAWAKRAEMLIELGERMEGRKGMTTYQVPGLRKSGKRHEPSFFNIGLSGGPGDLRHLLQQVRADPRQLFECTALALGLQELILSSLSQGSVLVEKESESFYGDVRTFELEKVEVLSLLISHATSIARDADARQE